MNPGKEDLNPLWTFTRFVRAHPDVAQLQAGEVFGRVHLVVCRWPRGWKHHFQMGRSEAETHFHAAWEDAKYRPGWGPLDEAILLARHNPLALPPSVKPRCSGYELFLSIAGWLQLLQQDKDIYLPRAKVAEKFLDTDDDGDNDVSAMRISHYRKWAVKDGLLEPQKPPIKKVRAETLRCRIDRFEELSGDREEILRRARGKVGNYEDDGDSVPF